MIETERLKIVPVAVEHLIAMQKDVDKIGDVLKVNVVAGWLAFPEVIEYSLNFLREHPDSQNWWMRFFIHKNDNALIGNGGFKGAPDANGIVEIGYAIAPAYQKQNLATEAAAGLIRFAFADPRVAAVEAHTLAEENASTKVLLKNKFVKIGEKLDTEDGDLWHWRLDRV